MVVNVLHSIKILLNTGLMQQKESTSDNSGACLQLIQNDRGEWNNKTMQAYIQRKWSLCKETSLKMNVLS